MKNSIRVIVILVLAAVVFTIIIAKGRNVPKPAEVNEPASAVVKTEPNQAKIDSVQGSSNISLKSTPKMVELGSHKCIPCQAMMQVLDELRAQCGDRLNIEFVDVFENEAAAQKYKVEIIPLQVFLDASGKELFRHEGFYPTQDILAKWKELGFEIKK
jgi:thioredoxin 1